LKPTIGRIVHYVNLGDADGKYPPTTQAAIITAIENPNDPQGRVWLKVFYKTGLFDCEVPYSPEPKRGHWSWPPREPVVASDSPNLRTA
jgi:hypothetical protein